MRRLKGVFGQGENHMKVGIYARVSTNDQHTLPLQMQALKKYVKHRQWKIALQIGEHLC